MSATNVENLEVPGATLHYEVSGQGPVLLLICGGPTDAAIYGGLAAALAENYTVVRYDPRGNSRSNLTGTPTDQEIEVYSDDAHRLLAALGDTPAFVVGSSGGALVGLDLAARHPEQVQTLIAHEPPAMELLTDSQRWRDHFQDVHDTYRKDGVGPAMGKFIAGVEEPDGPQAGAPAPQAAPPGPEMGPPDPEMMEMMGRMAANAEFFLGHVMVPFSRFVPDADALKAASTRVVLAAGEASKGTPIHQAGVVLADRVGSEIVDFPGDHQGFLTHSPQFAEQVHKVLTAGQ
ncbi:alpha/beta hydrolase [Streptomyces sp. NBC_00654]|uniref:alpha/beta fold hydrolase n=1 Tax=Streptomyces sp. NBC_00654 TaxID=2975799 RepID=UPI00224ECC6B|nr:alpha/beta hydrolase [Streptomyces sp. NBC_00654]MCX4970653.1 alpha/beta hydrolase [Streptomyces sp. NBC_00654]